MAKFYIVQATHKQTFKSLPKFGWTRSNDVLQRFDHSYPERELYRDFNFTVKFSIFLSEEEAIKLEDRFKEKYPDEVDVNEYFMKPKNYYNSNNLTGLTEMREWGPEELSQILQKMYSFKASKK